MNGISINRSNSKEQALVVQMPMSNIVSTQEFIGRDKFVQMLFHEKQILMVIVGDHGDHVLN